MKLRLLLCALMICVAVSVYAVNPWGEPEALPTSMTVVAQISIAGMQAQAGDVLAAFVSNGSQEVLRGKEVIVVNGSIAGCVIQIYTEQSGESIFFKVWDESAQLVYRASQDIESVVNGTLGSYPNDLFQISTSHIEQNVLPPVFNPPGGTFTSVQNVAITCPTPGAVIRYTCDGTEPTETSQLYVEPVFVGFSTTIKAKAFITDWIPSPTITAYFTITGGQIPDPWPMPEVFTSSMIVMARVNIFDVPASNGDILAAFVNGVLRGKQPIQVIDGISGCLLQVYSDVSGEHIEFQVWDYSAQSAIPANQYLYSQVNGIIGSYPNNLYIVNAGIYPSVELPVFSPPAGEYTEPFYVGISCPTEDAQIRYTLDGSSPTTSSTLYTQAILINVTTTVKARAYYGLWTPSAVVTTLYTVRPATPEDPPLTSITGIRDMYPNPFSSSVTLLLGVKEANQGYKLTIYNIRGELVYESSGIASGDFQHTWNGCATDGRKLPAGIYLVSFTSGTTQQTRKAVLK